MSLIPLGNNRVLKAVLLTVIGVFLCSFFVKSCRGSDLQMDFVTGATAVRGPTAAMGLRICQPRVIAHFADWCSGLTLLGDSKWHGKYSNYQAAIDSQVVAHLWGGFELGIGVAKLQHSDAYNSGDVNFSLSLARNVYKNFYLRYQHYSNAGTSDPNQGRDILLLDWRF